MAKSGVLLRRATKNTLIKNPPLVGEIVYSTDTNEHGWLDVHGVLEWGNLTNIEKPEVIRGIKQFFIDTFDSHPQNIKNMVYAIDSGEHGWVNSDGALVWAQLDKVFFAVAKNINVDVNEFTGVLSGTDISLQKVLEKLDEFSVDVPTAIDITVNTSSFQKNLPNTLLNIQETLNEIDSLELGEANPELGIGLYTKHLVNITNIKDALLALDALEVGEINEIINNTNFTGNLANQSFSSMQQVLDFLDTTEFGNKPTGLGYIVDGSNFGYRFIESPSNINVYGPLGNSSIDLSIAKPMGMEENLVLGATGDGSIAIGREVQSNGDNSISIGKESKATKSSSTAIGLRALSSGIGSTAIGAYTIAEGDYSVALNSHTKATNDFSLVAGRYNKGSIGNLFEVGNGTNAANLKNIFSVTTSGHAYLEESLIDGFVDDKQVTTKEYVLREVIRGGGENSELNGTGSTAFGTNNIVNSNYGFALGSYSMGNIDNVFEIGNGNDTARSNLFEVNSNGTISAPSNTNNNIVDNKNLITKGYLDYIVPTFITGLTAITEDSKSGYRLSGYNELYYGNIGTKAIDFSNSTIESTTLGATGENTIAFGENTMAPNKDSIAFGRNNIGNNDSVFEIGNGVDQDNKSNIFEIKNNGQILSPNLLPENILEDKALVTLEYFNANSSTTSVDTTLDTTNFNRNLSSTDTNVQKALETIDELILSDSKEFIDRTLEYANITNIDYNSKGKVEKTYYYHLGVQYYSVYTYDDINLLKIQYYENTNNVLLLSINYGYVNGKLKTITRV